MNLSYCPAPRVPHEPVVLPCTASRPCTCRTAVPQPPRRAARTTAGAILDVDAAAPESLAASGCMAVLAEHDEWWDAWCAAEAGAVRRQLEVG